jgi:hypothetical protein
MTSSACSSTHRSILGINPLRSATGRKSAGGNVLAVERAQAKLTS